LGTLAWMSAISNFGVGALDCPNAAHANTTALAASTEFRIIALTRLVKFLLRMCRQAPLWRLQRQILEIPSLDLPGESLGQDV